MVRSAKMKFRTEIPSPEKPALVRTDQGTFMEWPKGSESAMKAAKVTLQNEWDEHLRSVHPRQSEREQKKKARRRAAAERLNSKSKREQG
jgi:hypothetical protein